MLHCAESETELYLRAEVWGANGPAPALVHVTEVRGAAAAPPVIGPSSPVETRAPAFVDQDRGRRFHRTLPLASPDGTPLQPDPLGAYSLSEQQTAALRWQILRLRSFVVASFSRPRRSNTLMAWDGSRG